MPGKSPIVTFIGKSNSGKTTLLVKIIPELKKRGHRVATIKHSHHNVDVDKKGKDSWKHREAGADTVVLLSGSKMSIVKEFPVEPDVEAVRDDYIYGADIILAEGFKGSNLPKVWVFRSENSGLMINKDDSLVAVISDHKVDLGVPWFDINDISSVTSFLEERFLKRP